jgi:hypothetical protein
MHSHCHFTVTALIVTLRYDVKGRGGLHKMSSAGSWTKLLDALMSPQHILTIFLPFGTRFAWPGSLRLFFYVGAGGLSIGGKHIISSNLSVVRTSRILQLSVSRHSHLHTSAETGLYPTALFRRLLSPRFQAREKKRVHRSKTGGKFP